MEGYIQYPNGPEVRFSDDLTFVRKMKWDELEPSVQEQITPKTILYGLFDQDGELKALVRDSRLGFVLARQNDLKPTWMH